MNKPTLKSLEKRVKCMFCKKPIKDGELGGFLNANGLFCNNLPCLIELSDYLKDQGEDQPKEEWPKEGDKTFVLTPYGEIEEEPWGDTHRGWDWLAQGNIFPNRQAAEMEKLRRESRAKQKWVPDEHEEYWHWCFMENKEVKKHWSKGNFNEERWHMGNVHKTKEEAEEWGAKYGKCFEVPSEGI